jgi:hypothetical protein
MGGFLIRPDTAVRPAAAVGFQELGLGPGIDLKAGNWLVSVYSGRHETAPCVYSDNHGFIAVAGTLWFEHAQGTGALQLAFRKFATGPEFLRDAFGHFALVIWKHGRLCVMADAVGAFRIFFERSTPAVSTSFLTLATALPRAHFDRQSIYEYVLSGAVLGDGSLLEEIQTLPRDAILTFSETDIVVERSKQELPVRSAADKETLLDQTGECLNRFFTATSSSKSNGLSCALTAGYDSRLALANLRHLGVPAHVFVYGRNDANVRIARQIATGEGFDLEVIDRDSSPISPEAFPEVVHKNYLHDDGYDHEGFFTTNVEIEQRLSRTAGGAFVHGGGGEIFRNYFLLSDGPKSAWDVVHAMYGKYDESVCARGFDRHGYEERIVTKIEQLIGFKQKRYDRQIIEWLYPNFRCRAWFGRESSLNNMAGASFMPFYERNITDLAATIPLNLKRAGMFESELIVRADPRLAAYSSQYGHNFADPPPFRRTIGDTVKTQTPPILRPRLYALRERLGRSATEDYLSATYVESVLGRELHPVTTMFNMSVLHDPRMKSRVLSLAYLACRLGL